MPFAPAQGASAFQSGQLQRLAPRVASCSAPAPMDGRLATPFQKAKNTFLQGASYACRPWAVASAFHGPSVEVKERLHLPALQRLKGAEQGASAFLSPRRFAPAGSLRLATPTGQ